MRLLSKSLVVCVLLAMGATSSLQAQAIHGNMGIDSSLRLEYLVGSQVLRSTDGEIRQPNGFLIRFNPTLALLAGSVEVSPFSVASGRFAGAVSIVEPDTSSTRQLPDFPAELDWKARPTYGYWELAGLWHLSSGGGYRFSLTGGYRQSTWDYVGVLQSGGGSLKDKYVSHIPFIGLQTAMMFPWWKARFEVLGSPFMTQSSLVSMGANSNHVEQRVEANSGGLLEFQMEGTVSIYPNFWVGLYGRYHYQELYGHSSGGTYPPAAWNFADRFYTNESYASGGLNVNVVY
jgi:hypothetical protein